MLKHSRNPHLLTFDTKAILARIDRDSIRQRRRWPASKPPCSREGTLDLLILKALSTGNLHGLGVSRRIEQITGGTFVVQPGSRFPALHRLDEAGWLTSTWQSPKNDRRAKYYR